MDETDAPTAEERAGVRMIQGLQRLGGVVEPRDRALTGWRRMTAWERENTQAAYAVLCGELPEEEGGHGGTPAA